jgi:hypothetical protein
MNRLYVLAICDLSLLTTARRRIEEIITTTASGSIEIISMGKWQGSAEIAGINVKDYERESIKARVKQLFSFGLHSQNLIYKNRIGRVFFDSKVLKKITKIDFDEITIVSDINEVSIAIINLLGKITMRRTEQWSYIDLSSNDEYQQKTIEFNTYSPESIVIIQPDWTKCGSAKTFDLVGRLVTQHSLAPTRIVVGFGRHKNTISAGKIYSNSAEESFTGINLDIGIHGLISKIVLVNQILWSLTKSKRNSVVFTKHFLYASLRFNKAQIETILMQKPRIIYVNHYFNLPLANKIKSKLAANGISVRIILDTHDLQYLNYIEQNYKNPWSRYLPHENQEKEIEFKKLLKCDELIFVNVAEAESFTSWADQHGLKSPVIRIAIPISTDPVLHKKTPKPSSDKTVKFAIVMANNEANFLSLDWFIKKVVPNLLNQPVQISVYGSICNRDFGEFDSTLMNFRGPFERVDLIYSDIDVCIVPVRLGNGIAIKTLEAMQYGKMISSTKPGLRGLPSIAQTIAKTDEHELAQDIISLATSEKFRLERSSIIETAWNEVKSKSYSSQFKLILQTSEGHDDSRVY